MIKRSNALLYVVAGLCAGFALRGALAMPVLPGAPVAALSVAAVLGSVHAIERASSSGEGES